MAMNIPPPAKPANTSLIDTFSVNQLKTFSNGLQILSMIPPIASPMDAVASVKLPKLSTNPLRRLEIPVTTAESPPVRPSVSNPLFIDVKNSPVLAAISSIKSANLLTPSDWAKSLKLCTTACIPLANKSHTENRPSKVILILSLADSLKVKPSVKFFKFSVSL